MYACAWYFWISYVQPHRFQPWPPFALNVILAKSQAKNVDKTMQELGKQTSAWQRKSFAKTLGPLTKVDICKKTHTNYQHIYLGK